MGISKEGLLRPSDCVKNIHDGKEVNSFSLSNFTACLTRIKRKEQHIEYFLRTNWFNNSKMCTIRLILQKIDVCVELFRIFKYKLSRMVRICKCYHLKIKTTGEKLEMGIPHIFRSFVRSLNIGAKGCVKMTLQ